MPVSAVFNQTSTARNIERSFEYDIEIVLGRIYIFLKAMLSHSLLSLYSQPQNDKIKIKYRIDFINGGGFND